MTAHLLRGGGPSGPTSWPGRFPKKIRMTVKTVLTPDDITSMMNAAECLRDRVILQFYADTGARESELLAVTVQDIDFDQGTVLIPHLKRGAKKHCPKCGKTAGRLGKWCSNCGADLSRVMAEGIQQRTRIISLGKETLDMLHDFTGGMERTDRVINLSRQSVYNIIRGLAEKAGLAGKMIVNPESGRKHFVHPHILRSSLAVDWLDQAQGDVNSQKALQEHLGHKSFDTTMKYRKLAPSDVRREADKVRQLRFQKGK